MAYYVLGYPLLLVGAGGLATMGEKPVVTKAKKSRRETASPEGKRQEPDRRETRKRVRKTVERHRETCNELGRVGRTLTCD